MPPSPSAHLCASLGVWKQRSWSLFNLLSQTPPPVPVGVSSAVRQTKCCCARRWKICLTSQIPSLSVLSVLWYYLNTSFEFAHTGRTPRSSFVSACVCEGLVGAARFVRNQLTTYLYKKWKIKGGFTLSKGHFMSVRSYAWSSVHGHRVIPESLFGSLHYFNPPPPPRLQWLISVPLTYHSDRAPEGRG